LKISANLKSGHENSRKNKILKDLDKINYSNVQKKIGKDLRAKREKKM